MSAIHTFAIEGECSIYRAAELAQELRSWASNAVAGDMLHLDLSQVTEIDGAGLQLILSLQRSVNEQGCNWQLIAANPCVQSVLALTGLSELLRTRSAPSSVEDPA